MISLYPLSLLLFLFSLSYAQSDDFTPAGTTISFRPSVAIVIGIFAMMFSLTCLLLMYAKFCHSSPTPNTRNDVFLSPDRAFPAIPSGLDKSIIQSLPFFHFSALRGTRAGLECAVCLSPYADTELLRLLPTCKHAFHLSCVDEWLEQHSSCPLCRTEVSAHPDESGETIPSDLFSLFIEREPSTRFDDKIMKELIQDYRREDVLNGPEYDKFKHRIVISDSVLHSRWSALNSADLMSLNCDMLGFDSSRMFTSLAPLSTNATDKTPIKIHGEKVTKVKEEMERSSNSKELSSSNGEPSAMISHGTRSRSMSDVFNLARFRRLRDPNPIATVDDPRRRLWLPIAWRTVRWFTGRERGGYARDTVTPYDSAYPKGAEKVNFV